MTGMFYPGFFPGLQGKNRNFENWLHSTWEIQKNFKKYTINIEIKKTILS